MYQIYANTDLLFIIYTIKTNFLTIQFGLLFVLQIISISYLILLIFQQSLFLLAMTKLLNQTQLLKRKNCQKLFYIFFIFSNFIFFLSLKLFKIHPTIYKFLIISKCLAIFEWEFSLTFASFFLLVDYLSIGKLLSKVFFNLFYID